MMGRKSCRYGFMAVRLKRAHRKRQGIAKRHPLLLACIAVLSIVMFPFPAITGGSIQDKEPAVSLAEKWGIEILGVRMASRGHMVDFRYRIVDAAKSVELFSRNTKPYLIDNESGKVLAVPRFAKVGALRSTNQPLEGKAYWMFFGNPGVVKTGSRVTVVIGDLKLKDLIVQ